MFVQVSVRFYFSYSTRDDGQYLLSATLFLQYLYVCYMLIKDIINILSNNRASSFSDPRETGLVCTYAATLLNHLIGARSLV